MKPGETTHSDYQLSDGGRVELMMRLAGGEGEGRLMVLMSLLHEGRLIFDRELIGSAVGEDSDLPEFWPEVFATARHHVASVGRTEEMRSADQLAWARWFGPHLLDAELIGTWTEGGHPSGQFRAGG